MKYKKGDKLICKKKCRLKVGQEATVAYILKDEIHVEWESHSLLLRGESYIDDAFTTFDNVHEYFYSKKELRKIKLKEINGQNN